MNHLKAGLACADRLLTVSPGEGGAPGGLWGGRRRMSVVCAALCARARAAPLRPPRPGCSLAAPCAPPSLPQHTQARRPAAPRTLWPFLASPHPRPSPCAPPLPPPNLQNLLSPTTLPLPGYSQEITTFLGGWGLEGLLLSRSPVLNGIVNGIDEDEWVPLGGRGGVGGLPAKLLAGRRACALLGSGMGSPGAHKPPSTHTHTRFDSPDSTTTAASIMPPPPPPPPPPHLTPPHPLAPGGTPRRTSTWPPTTAPMTLWRARRRTRRRCRRSWGCRWTQTSP